MEVWGDKVPETQTSASDSEIGNHQEVSVPLLDRTWGENAVDSTDTRREVLDLFLKAHSLCA